MRCKTLNMLSALNLGDTNPRGRRDKIVRGVHKVIKAESVFTSHSVAYLVIKSYFSEVLEGGYFLKSGAFSVVTSCCTSPTNEVITNFSTTTGHPTFPSCFPVISQLALSDKGIKYPKKKTVLNNQTFLADSSNCFSLQN